MRITPTVLKPTNVSDVERSIPFYEALSGQRRRRSSRGYAKFSVAEPALNFTLNEGETAAGTGAFNHAGIQVAGTDDVIAAKDRLVSAGLATFDEMRHHLLLRPPGQDLGARPGRAPPWEVFATHDDSEEAGDGGLAVAEQASCDGAARQDAVARRRVRRTPAAPSARAPVPFEPRQFHAEILPWRKSSSGPWRSVTARKRGQRCASCSGRAAEVPHFNLSHTDGLALIAISRVREVGVDVERVRPVRRAEAIARRVFSQEQAEAVAEAGEGERDLLFHRFWVAYEARLKLGTEPALVRELEVPEGYVAAVAIA